MTEDQLHLLVALRPLVLLHLSEEDEARALRIASGMLEVTRRHADRSVKAEALAAFDALMLVGDIHHRCGENTEAALIYREALDLLEENEEIAPEEMVVCRLKQKLGTILDNRGASEDALPLLVDALDILDRQEETPPETTANLCNNLGMIYRTKEQFPEAEAHYLRALKIFEEQRGDDHLTVAAVLNNLGTLHWASHQLEKARDYHVRALEIRTESLPATHSDLGQSASNLAAVYHMLGEFNNASQHYERAIRILEDNLCTDADTYEIVVQNYADLLKDHDHRPKAEKLLKTCKKLLSKARA